MSTSGVLTDLARHAPGAGPSRGADRAHPGPSHPAIVTGPAGRAVAVALCQRDTAAGLAVIVPAAAICGADLLTPADDPSAMTTRGLGEALLHALDLDPVEIVVDCDAPLALDGGTGLLTALGVRVLDAVGGELGGGPETLSRAAWLDVAGLDPRLRRCRLTIGVSGCSGSGHHDEALRDWAALLLRHAGTPPASLGPDDPTAGVAATLGAVLGARIEQSAPLAAPLAA